MFELVILGRSDVGSCGLWLVDSSRVSALFNARPDSRCAAHHATVGKILSLLFALQSPSEVSADRRRRRRQGRTDKKRNTKNKQEKMHEQARKEAIYNLVRRVIFALWGWMDLYLLIYV